MICAYLYSIIGDWGKAVDLGQETFIVAFEKLGDYDGDRPASPWLRGIARNLARNFLRKRGRWRILLAERADIEQSFALLDEAGEEDGRARRLERCLKRLPARQRGAVRLFYESGKTARECASAMKVRQKTVYQLLWQARASLRRCLGERGKA